MNENKPVTSFKTLITKEEYKRLIKQFGSNQFDLQTNYYFDTDRFSLKAKAASFKIKKRDGYEVILKVPTKFKTEVFAEEIDEPTFQEITKKGLVDLEHITRPLNNLIGGQKIFNFLTLTTKRTILKYNDGFVFIDENHYVETTDYDLEYVTKSNFHQARTEFIEVINHYKIGYQKTDKKIKRAFNAFRATI